MRRPRQVHIRVSEHRRTWDGIPAAVHRAVRDLLRELWLAAFRRQLEVMRDEHRQDHA